jgi:UDP-N-acetylmuramyl tripeptide synthase
MARPRLTSILVGKAVRLLAHLRGQGSALPGYVVERLDPNFIQFLADLPRGVVVISGTNGKTTTTKIVTELLQSAGLRVFTNNTGSNFVRGVISAALPQLSLSGKFPFDIAVLELDEAHAVRFVEKVAPTYSLLLNVARDQLDRFGEIDHTAKLLEIVARATTGAVVINREDPRLAKIQAPDVRYFGLSDKLRALFPDDDHLLGVVKNTTPVVKNTTPNHDVVLSNLRGDLAEYRADNKILRVPLKLRGVYNAYNAAGALALAHAVLPDHHLLDFSKALGQIESAFGRGETFTVHGRQVELLLVKNPSAFQLSLASFVEPGYDYMIAINDQYADGRDMSWLWNVDFTALPRVAVASGIRAADMALRLQYDEVPVGAVTPDLATALATLTAKPKTKLRIFATYTAMLELRKIIKGKSLL